MDHNLSALNVRAVEIPKFGVFSSTAVVSAVSKTLCGPQECPFLALPQRYTRAAGSSFPGSPRVDTAGSGRDGEAHAQRSKMR